MRGSNDCFSKLVNLKVLNLSYNCFSTCEIDDFSKMRLPVLTNLIEIDFSHQYDPMFVQSNVSFSSPSHLTKLNFAFTLQPSEKTSNFTLNIAPPPKHLNFQSNSVTVLQAFRTSETNSSIPMEVSSGKSS